MPRRVVVSDSDDDDEPAVEQQEARSSAYRIKKRASAPGASTSSAGGRESPPHASPRAAGTLPGTADAAIELSGGPDDEDEDDAVEVADVKSAPIDVDEDDDACWTCGEGGELLCCDGRGCDAQHHLTCVDLRRIPKGKWYCPVCAAKKALKAKAAGSSAECGGTAAADAPKTKARKLLRDDELAESTRAAIAAEKERLAKVGGAATSGAADTVGAPPAPPAAGAVAASAKDEADDIVIAGPGGAPAGGAWTLNPAEVADSPGAAVSVSAPIARAMKPHQKEAVRFLFQSLIVTVSAVREGSRGFGAVLAHSMGLGKTLTTLALLDALLTSRVLHAAGRAAGARPIRTALVVAPATVLDNWLDEVDKWAAGAAYVRARACARGQTEASSRKRVCGRGGEGAWA